MNKKESQQLIAKTLNAKFNDKQFTLFIKNLLNEYETKNNNYHSNQQVFKDAFRPHIESYKRIAKYTDPNGIELDVLIVKVKELSKLERARTVLRNFVINHLKTFGEKDYALVAFYTDEDQGADWRFSFIKLEHQAYLDEKQDKVKVKEKFTPAKRYSFLVGELEHSHTAQNQLLPLLQNIVSNPTVEEIETAFSIEKVTDEFYEQYKALYIKLHAHFTNDEYINAELSKAKIDTERFTKKLLGQIVFLYFLQKKGWLGVAKDKKWGKGDKLFLQNLFDRAEKNNNNYFKDYLQPLFYEALAKERDNENAYYQLLDCRIPFLNGGLFEADYHWQQAKISIPKDYFRNQEKSKAGDKGTGILDVFDRYNFTIKEDEPLDKEVAVDPEMLGKVFEKMLPENERKGKGAFYTPREIVHYMCQQSLIHYLDNALENEIDKKDIEKYILQGHLSLENDQRVVNHGKETGRYKYQLPETIRKHADTIDQKLKEIRICDPAIGSGAFPVGMLHELVTAHLILKPHLSQDYLKQQQDEFGFPFHESINESRYIYRLKRHIIQESLYGVDIDASAIDIARLRLWLSLVVDEDDLDPIETLPNLDYKIVCGNSLIGMPDNTLRNEHVVSELEALKKDFYSETNERKKKELRININKKIRELLDSAEQWANYSINFDFELYFSEVWHEKGGFDVVIGNPPYVRQELFKEYKKYLKENYSDIYDGRADLYTYFIKRGFELLHNLGTLSFITSNKYIVRGYGKRIRKLLASEKTLKSMVNFGELPVFKASVDSLIIIAQNKLPLDTDFINYVQATKHEHIININNLFSKHCITKKISSLQDSWVFKDENTMQLLEKLNNLENKISDIFNIFGGIKTGLDRAFIIDKSKRLELIEKDMNSDKLIKPWYRGRDIQKWVTTPQLFVIYIPQNEISIDDYPAIKEHLIKFKVDLEKRATKQKWYELQQPQKRFTELFNDNKIIYSEIAKEMRALYDSGKAYGTMKMFFIPYNPIMLALLNSKLFDWYARMNFSSLGDPLNGGRLEFKTLYMSKVPIPVFSVVDEILCKLLTNYIFYIKSTSNEMLLNFFELLLDSIIFELYFSEELKKANKQVIKHLQDLKPINDSMSQEQKLTIIQSEFERLYDPEHPVRNAIETLDSIEEVRIIKEALK